MIIATARDAADLLLPFFASADRERIVVAHLSLGRRVIRTNICADGCGSEIDLPIREIVEDSLRLGGAGLIVAHNHPSGDPTPSEEDLAATRRLAAAANSLGIRLHDHLIIGAAGECRSLRALGLL